MARFFADDGIRTLGEMSIEEAFERLKLVDEAEAKAFLHEDKPYKHSSHVFGYIAPDRSGAGELAIQPVGSIAADTSLKGKQVIIALNRLAVAEYPGGGTHEVLFEFTAENKATGKTEPVNFSAKHRVSKGGSAGIINAPIFVGLVVGQNMLSFKCRTVNIVSDNDSKFLSFLESDMLRKGLELASIAQPAVAPLSAMVTGITKSVIANRQNVAVQNIEMGLDFGGTAGGARLALGDYVAVQVPSAALPGWDWSSWKFKPQAGQILSSGSPAKVIPYNYVMFGISLYNEP